MKRIIDHLIDIAKEYDVDLTEIGGYNWVFGIPHEFSKSKFYSLSKRLEHLCEDTGYEFNTEIAYDGVPIMIEIKGLADVADFYEGGRDLNQKQHFWDDKPRAMCQVVKLDNLLNKDISEVEKKKESEFGNLSDEEKDLITIHRLKQKYGEKFDKMVRG